MLSKNLVSLEDWTTQQIIDVLNLATEIDSDIKKYKDLASGYLMANLFLEPSTRTLGSFESAMKRMGAQTITVSDINSSSMVKGESLADTIRIWSGYADLLVLRHPWEGSAKLASEYSDVPVINAGDGSHEHPTQTLCDLFTLRKEHGSLDGLKVVMCGDLKNGRTVNSLTCALIRFGAQIIFVPGEGLGLSDHMIEKLEVQYSAPLTRIDPESLGLSDLVKSINKSNRDNAIYSTPKFAEELGTENTFCSVSGEGKKEKLVLYMTRKQNERDKNLEVNGDYPKINASVMKHSFLSNAILMHPLPRVDEIATDLDRDPRSIYFQQARNGVPVRMALIALLLQLRHWSDQVEGEEPFSTTTVGKREVGATVCSNQVCVTKMEPQSVEKESGIINRDLSHITCVYCGRLISNRI